jgi:hypothetical protein
MLVTLVVEKEDLLLLHGKWWQEVRALHACHTHLDIIHLTILERTTTRRGRVGFINLDQGGEKQILETSRDAEGQCGAESETKLQSVDMGGRREHNGMDGKRRG